MSDVDDLVTWLRAQLDDDERVARVMPGPSPEQRSAAGDRDYLTPVDPARVLAEVDAKRRIVELYDVSTSRELKPDAWELMKHAVRALALPYADRPGYREDWRP